MRTHLSVRPTVMRAALALVALTAFALAGGSACDPCGEIEGAAAAEVGTADSAGAFAPIEDGQSLPYVRGIQGGTHVEGSVRIDNLFFPEDAFLSEAELPLVTFTLHDSAAVQVGGFQDEPQPFSPTAGRQQGERLGVEVRFFADGSEFVGDTLRLFVEVKDTCGQRASDERTIVIAEGA